MQDHCIVQEFISTDEVKISLLKIPKCILLIEKQFDIKDLIVFIDNKLKSVVQLLIIYGESFDSEEVREWFLQGVHDVQKIENISWKSITSLFDVKYKTQNSEDFSGNDYDLIIRRGALIEQSLVGGSLPVYYMNTNRIEYLRADVTSINDSSSSWYHIAITEWIHEFGKNNSFVYLRPNSYQGMRLGAMVDIDEENRSIFRNKLSARLDRFFSAIKRIGCVSVASSCNAEYLDYSVASYLDHQNEMIFFHNNSCYITARQSQEMMAINDDTLIKFGEAIVNEDISLAASYINQTVDILCKGSFLPAYAYAKLSSFARILSIIQKTDEFEYSLNPYRAKSIFALRDQLLSLITKTKLMTRQYVDFNKKANEKISNVISSIKRNPTLEYSAEKTAESLGYSRSHFCRMFRKIAGESFGTFVKSHKLKYAAELLLQTNFDICEVGNIVGYSNTWYFNKAFELQYGLSPDLYREKRPSIL